MTLESEALAVLRLVVERFDHEPGPFAPLTPVVRRARAVLRRAEAERLRAEAERVGLRPSRAECGHRWSVGGFTSECTSPVGHAGPHADALGGRWTDDVAGDGTGPTGPREVPDRASGTPEGFAALMEAGRRAAEGRTAFGALATRAGEPPTGLLAWTPLDPAEEGPNPPRAEGRPVRTPRLSREAAEEVRAYARASAEALRTAALDPTRRG